MSVKSICTGDVVKKVTVTGGSFGSSPVFTESDCCIDCRIDINGGSESNATGVPNEMRSGTVFFSKNPSLSTGNYLRWVSRGGVRFASAIMLRVTTIDDAEGRPGEPAWLWSVQVDEDKQTGVMIRAAY